MIILKKKKTLHRKAFSMITAIFVIVIMATITALILNVTGKTLKATTQQYQKEQAGLLARSYTELAIMYVIHYDRTAGDCLETITDHFGATGDNGYDIRMNINYIGNDTLLANCTQNIDIDGDLGVTTTWTDDGNTGFNNTVSLVIDTYISYKDFDDPSALVANGNRSITFHRRTLQKL